jgi:curved DNA-binding protein CbpA
MNPYEVLGIKPDASDAEVRGAYFSQVQKHPPERDPEGFKTVRAAYEMLRDGRARAHYFLDQFEELPIEALCLPEPQPVPITRELILLADPQCEVLRTDFSEDAAKSARGASGDQARSGQGKELTHEEYPRVPSRP